MVSRHTVTTSLSSINPQFKKTKLVSSLFPERFHFFMKITGKFLPVILMSCLGHQLAYASNEYSWNSNASSNNWFTANNWNIISSPTPTQPALQPPQANDQVDIDFTAPAGGTVLANGTTPILGTILVGVRNGTGRLTIQNGGVLKTTNINAQGNGQLSAIGYASNGAGGGQGFVIINQGGVWNHAGALILGMNQGAGGTLLVDGVGSRLITTATNSDANLAMGTATNTIGVMTIQNGGLVRNGIGFNGTQTTTFLGQESGGSGTLNLNSLGVLETPRLAVGNGSGTANFNGGILRALATDTTFIKGFTGTNHLNLTGNGIIIDSNSFNIAPASNNIFSGTGNLTKIGLGNLTFSSAHTYTGSTTIGGNNTAGGNLILTAAHILDSNSAVNLASGDAVLTVNADAGAQTLNNIAGVNGSVIAVNNNAIILSNTLSSTFVGRITGTNAATLTKQGAGMLILNGDDSGFAGTTNVLAGILQVNGVLGGNVNVSANGSLQGTGSVSNLAVSGIIAPGNSIGTLTVQGSYVQNPGSVYQVEISPTLSDLIVVNGPASIGGTVAVSKAPNALYAPRRYTILAATGDVTGQYTNLVQDNTYPFLNFSLSYDANDAYLNIVQNTVPFSDLTKNGNQALAANAVQGLGAGNPIFDAFLNFSNPAQVQQALNSLSGEVYVSSLSAMIEESRYLRDAIAAHLTTDRNDKEQRVVLANGLTAWAHGFGAWGELDGDRGQANALKRETYGFFIGAEREFGNTGRAGVVGGYSHSHYDVEPVLSINRNDNYHIGLYADSRFNAWHVLGGGAFTWHDLDATRTVAFPNFLDNVDGDYHAFSGQAFGQLGYELPFKQFIVEPLINAAYVNLHADRFREFGGSAALAATHASQDVFYTTLGAREQAMLYQQARFNLNERVFLGWRHAYSDITPTMPFVFASGSTPFPTTGVPIAKDALLIDAGVDVTRADENVRLRLSYLGQFGSHVSDNAVAATLTWRLA